MRVLIVEDDAQLSATLARGLREEGFGVECARDAEEGRAWLDMGPFDALILDWRLPGRSGLDFLADLRAQRISMPVLMLTAMSDVHHRVAGLDQGADDYLTKPFSLLELIARLRAITRRAQPETDYRLRFADLVLDPLSREVTRGERHLDLTPREFQLLELFLRHPERVLTRSIIADQVWGFCFDVSSNLIDVHIRKLRTKLEEEGEPRILHTQRGVGYQLKSERSS
ncbi:Response regulator transcription factor [Sulfidibacter corallicola]|uniref:Response regulator transcription factor n=1 Tax=Sulfidibacter corallicola TaxID=2818388 RepID=A0A8A4TQB8_SULCO|nr:response regulator transcription factor [Sulfidibacter corallicola]QTD51750.1 response regulator transcription factor [Sulfidibacter corallicola]